mgnify:CR=1 FL=1
MMIKRVWPSLGYSLPEPSRLLRDFGRFFDAAYGEGNGDWSPGVFPPLNVTRDEENYFVRAELPGLNSDELKISVEHNKLCLSGARQATEQEGVSYHRRERGYGTFSRSINLPYEVDADKVQANYKLGVLEVLLPKAEDAKPRKIAISS